MKHIFIINPKAGKGRGVSSLCRSIEEHFRDRPQDAQILLTTEPREGMHMARRYAATGEDMRVYACGGDGTMFDVVNGIYGYPNAALGVIPMGTANDFLKYFGSLDSFRDIGAQTEGHTVDIDLIRVGEWYAANICSMGMDAEVCANKDRFSRLPFVRGRGAYILAMLYGFFTKIRNQFSIEIDGREVASGDHLFAVAANGRYYGGGFCCAPDALVDDGLLDCVLVRSVSRLKIVSLLKEYTEGRHTNREFCTIMRGRVMKVKARGKSAVNMDGEVIPMTEAEFEIIPKGLRFVLPSVLKQPTPERVLTAVR